MERAKDALGWALGVAVSGLLLAVSLPPISFGYAGWFALVPVLMGTRKFGVALGFAAGIGISLVAAAILASGFLLPKTVQEGSQAWIYTGFALFGLVIGFVLAFRAGFTRLKDSPLALACMATLLEVPLLLYLPAHLGLTQHKSTAMLELSAWTGIWGVSFCVWYANFAVTEYQSKIRRWGILLPLGALGLSAPFLAPERGDYVVAALQTRTQDLDQLSAMGARAKSNGAKLVVWPELSAMSTASGAHTDALVALSSQKEQAPFVTTFPDSTEPKPYNTASLFSNGTESQRYRKRKPFAAERQMHASGTDAVTVPFDGHQVALAICFDSCFPAVMRQSAGQGNPGFMVLPSLDPETPGGVCQSLHGAYTAFAAASVGLPIIRSEITSHAQIFDAHGRIISQSTGSPDELITGSIKPGKRWTFQTYAGDWFLIVCAACLIFKIKRSKVSLKE